MDIVLLPCKGILGGEGWNLFPISLAASFGTGDIPPGKVQNLISIGRDSKGTFKTHVVNIHFKIA
jgi:hypothetical protein